LLRVEDSKRAPILAVQANLFRGCGDAEQEQIALGIVERRNTVDGVDQLAHSLSREQPLVAEG
jgi:hypothetical protein